MFFVKNQSHNATRPCIIATRNEDPFENGVNNTTVCRVKLWDKGNKVNHSKCLF